ncbi:DUF421 domain-containing protein [Paenibacillus sp. JSM ZJ436]|uniref:DUF421 domain-containing protein n=1 Tax=Paenibacillus sp. JSM ZJ436 TaxID=3376190 RepID=UPI0037875BA6
MFFSSWNDLLRIVIIGVLSYLSLILMVRISGKRTLSKMNAFDFTVSVAVGSSFSTVILNKDITLAEGLTAFLVLIGMQYLLAWCASRSRRFRRVLQSSPELVYYQGQYVNRIMKKNRIDEHDIYQSVRSEGVTNMNEVYAVVLEPNGKLSVLQNAEAEDNSILEEAKPGHSFSE